MKPMLYENERIVAIEYHREPAWTPFDVMTIDGHCPNRYDFEWSKRDKALYYEMAGCGGTSGYYVGRFSKPSPPPGLLWLAEGTRAVSASSQSSRPFSTARLLKMGYRVIDQPLWLTRFGLRTQNPFEVAEESDAQWCSVCKSYVATEHPCEHIEWCDECGWWVNNATHKWADGDAECEHLKVGAS